MIYKKIKTICGFSISKELDVIIDEDGKDYYIAKFINTHPFIETLYGYGGTTESAFQMLQNELDNLYIDVNEDNDYTGEILDAKDFLNEITGN